MNEKQFETTEDLYNMNLKERQLREMATFKWIINQNHRAWFLSSDGDLHSGTTHRSILKNDFSKNWNLIEETDEYRKEEILEHRLLKTGTIKIGEINDNFYVDIQNLNKREIDLLQGFSNSIIESNAINISKSNITISIKELKKTFTITLEDIANDKLFNLV